MATDISRWTLDDCVKYIERMAKSHHGQMTTENFDLIVANFRTNCICGHDMLRLGDSEWKELIPFMGFRIHMKAAVDKIIEENKREAISQLHRRGLAKKPVEQTTALLPIPRITSFFKPGTRDVLELPEESDIPISIPDNEMVVPKIPETILTKENLGNMINYVMRQQDKQKFVSLILRKAITEYYFLNDKNKKNTASFLATISIANGSKEAQAGLEDQWRSSIKYYLKTSGNTAEIDIEDFLSYFIQNGKMKNVRNTDSGNAGYPVCMNRVELAHRVAAG